MKSLFDTTYIGNIKLKNRFIRSATLENMCTEDGHVTEKLFKLYEALAYGGVAMIITGCSSIFKCSDAQRKMLGIYDDTFIDEFKKITDMVHYNRCKIAMEIYDENDISKHSRKNIINAFADAALRVKKSGFDAVEIYSAGGCTDTGFIMDVYHCIRERVGKEFSVFFKMDPMDDTSMYICRRLEEDGINAVEISYNRECAYKIAKNEKCPVILGGFNRSMENMNKTLNDSNIAYFSMARPFICEPDLINKWLSGATAVSSCKSCNNCMGKDGIKCIHNI